MAVYLTTGGGLLLAANAGRVLGTGSGDAPDPPGPPEIGDAYGGGYYLADFTHNGVTYRLVLAPKSSEIRTAWSIWDPPYLDGVTDPDDGPGNTAYNVYGGYSAALHCDAYDGGGYTDWYLGAVNELTAMVPNFPLLPPAEAIEISEDGSTHLWSSTEDTQENALKVNPASVWPYGNHKNNTGLVRPVRRVPIV